MSAASSPVLGPELPGFVTAATLLAFLPAVSRWTQGEVYAYGTDSPDPDEALAIAAFVIEEGNR